MFLNARAARSIFLICLNAILLTACQHDDPKTVTVTSPGRYSATNIDSTSESSADTATRTLELQVNENQLPASLKDLAKKLNQREDISFDQLTRAWIEQHRAVYFARQNNNTGPVVGVDRAHYPYSVIGKLVSSMTRRQSPTTNKGEYEGELENFLSKMRPPLVKLQYQAAATTLFDAIIDGRLQGYSGTVLNQIVFRALGSKLYRDFNFVVIFESGHVLPGYVENARINGERKLYLYGMETMTSGKGIKFYGELSQLQNVAQPIRVVDAELFALIEIFKSHVTDPAQLNLAVEKALKVTAEKYGINLDALEAKLKTGHLRSAQSYISDQYRVALNPLVSTSEITLTASPFAFIRNSDVSAIPAAVQDRPFAMQLLADFSSVEVWNRSADIIRDLSVERPRQ